MEALRLAVADVDAIGRPPELPGPTATAT